MKHGRQLLSEEITDSKFHQKPPRILEDEKLAHGRTESQLHISLSYYPLYTPPARLFKKPG
jgi:hypothetical protein